MELKGASDSESVKSETVTESRSPEPGRMTDSTKESLVSLTTPEEPKAEKVEASTKQRPAKSIGAALRKKIDEPAAPQKVEKLAAPTVAQVAPATPAPAAAQSIDPILAPADMSPEKRAMFDKLPPEAKAYLSERAYQVRNYLTQNSMALAAKEREISDVLSAVAPVRDEYARQGVNVPDLVKNAIAWDRHMKTNRVQAAKEYLDSYGIDPAELMEVAPGQQAPIQQPQGLTQEQVQEMVQAQLSQARETQQHEHRTQQSYSAVQSFISSKPLFRDPGTAAQLEAKLAPVVAGLRAANPQAADAAILDEAYNYVTRGDPTFAGLVNRLEQKTEIERTNAEAQKALAASRSISGGPGSGTPTRKVKDIGTNLRLRMSGAL
jgi:hypothetical protein